MIDVNEGFNIKIHDLKTDLVNTINTSGLPVGVVYYILKDLLNEVTDSYKQSLAIEKQVIEMSKEEDVDGHQE